MVNLKSHRRSFVKDNEKKDTVVLLFMSFNV